MLYDLVGQEANVHCLLFDYHQTHRIELEHGLIHCDRLKVQRSTMWLPMPKGSTLTDGKGTFVVPNRNAILLSHAVNFALAAEADYITMAVNKDDSANFPDCRLAFFDAFNKTLREAGLDMFVRTPYIDRSKSWIARLGDDMGVKRSDTWSCYGPGPVPCGVCLACKMREASLKV